MGSEDSKDRSAAGSPGLPAIDMMCIGKRGGGGPSEDVVAVVHDPARGRILAAVADGATHGDDAVRAAELAALAAEAAIAILGRIDLAGPQVVAERLLAELPGYIAERLTPRDTGHASPGAILRTCALAAAVIEPHRFTAAVLGDCFVAGTGADDGIERIIVIATEADDAPPGVCAVARVSTIGIGVASAVAIACPHPEVLYLGSDGAYRALYEVYDAHHAEIDRVPWFAQTGALIERQEPGTIYNDDICVVRARFR